APGGRRAPLLLGRPRSRRHLALVAGTQAGPPRSVRAQLEDAQAPVVPHRQAHRLAAPGLEEGIAPGHAVPVAVQGERVALAVPALDEPDVRVLPARADVPTAGALRGGKRLEVPGLRPFALLQVKNTPGKS